jgi:hypothetical protein
MAETLTKFTDPGTAPSYNMYNLAWSPSGNHLAVFGYYLYLYSNSGGVLTLEDSFKLGDYGGYTGAWSPDGNYLLAGSGLGTALKFYSVSGSTLTELTDPDEPNDEDSSVYAIAWTPDGNYVVVGCTDGYGGNDTLLVYSHSAGTLTLLDVPDDQPAEEVWALEFTSDGDYLAVGHQVSGLSTEVSLKIYSFDAGELTLVGSPTAYDGDGTTKALAWDSTDTYLVAGKTHDVDDYIAAAFKHDGEGGLTRLTLTHDANDTAEAGWSVAWHGGGRYVVVGGDGENNEPVDIIWWRRDGDTFTQLDAPDQFPDDYHAYGAGWNGDFLAVSGWFDDHLWVYQASGLQVEEPTYASIRVPILTRIGKYGDVQLSVAPLTSIGDVPIPGDMELVVPLYTQVGDY